MKTHRLLTFVLMSIFMFSGCTKMDKRTATEDRNEIFNVLVFSKAKDYRHASIEDGQMAIVKLGEEYGFKVDTTEDASLFYAEKLNNYRVIVFLNTDGEILNDDQKAAFAKYIKNGGAFVGIHGAAATESNWEWYGNLVGAFFSDHPEQQTATVRVVDNTHLSTIALPEAWERYDEWYNYKVNPKDKVNVLLTLDETTYTGGAHGEFHPIAWYHTFEGARSWYTGLGHTKESYRDPYFLSHVLGGILYAAGFSDDDDRPLKMVQ